METNNFSQEPLKIGEIISGAFSQFGKNAGIYIGAIVIIFAMLLAGSVFSMLIPILGGFLVSAIISTAFLGLANVAYNSDYKGSGSFEDVFKTFNRFGQLVLASLIIQIVAFLPMLVALIPIFSAVWELVLAAMNESDPEVIAEIVAELFTGTNLILFILGMLGVFYVYVSYSFTYYFIYFKKMDFWQAMEASRKLVNSRLIDMIALHVVMFFLILGGTLMLFIGLLIALPICQLIYYQVFKSMVGFGETTNPSDHLV
jgi:uncharacterized membrane protein